MCIRDRGEGEGEGEGERERERERSRERECSSINLEKFIDYSVSIKDLCIAGIGNETEALIYAIMYVLPNKF